MATKRTFAPDDGSPVHLAGALIGASALARNQGDVDEAKQLVMESIAVAKSADDRRLEARAIGSLANVALARGDYPLASELQLETETIFRALGDERLVAISLGNPRTRRSASATSPLPSLFRAKRSR